jgi:hypothetical protein
MKQKLKQLPPEEMQRLAMETMAAYFTMTLQAMVDQARP